jgi:hypothetical protein
MLIFLVSIGCEEKTTDPPANDNNFTFAKVGNKWTFKVTSDSHTSDMTQEIIKDMGNHIYKVETIYQGASFGTVYLFWYVNGEEMSFNTDSSGLHKNFLFNSSSEVNKTYMSIVEYSPFLQSGDTVYAKILSLDESVTVPAGTFSCIKIQVWGGVTSSMPESMVYFNRKVGQIKQTSESMTLELKYKNF